MEGDLGLDQPQLSATKVVETMNSTFSTPPQGYGSMGVLEPDQRNPPTAPLQPAEHPQRWMQR
jgi:hypothetical protein